MNLQDSKAGNCGDILKHAALVSLAECLEKECQGTPIHYLDTHTYRLTAPLPDPETWSRESAALSEIYPAYSRYIELERVVLKGDPYRCSAQIVLDLLKIPPHLYLAEKGDVERVEINAALRKIPNLPDPIVLTDMHQYANFQVSRKPGPVLALIDPHYIDDEEWARVWTSANSFIKRIHEPSCAGAVLVYKWQPSDAVTWPAPFDGWSGPLATISQPTGEGEKHHHLAFYAAGDAKPFVEALVQLGWKLPSVS